jgi:ABC-2 type transport system permease protein
MAGTGPPASWPACACAGSWRWSWLILLYALWFTMVTCSFWLVQVDTLDTHFYSVFETARYPVTFFKGLVSAVLTFAIPVAFATTFPVQPLLGTVGLRLLIAGIALATVALILTHLFWSYAVRYYSSASS